MSQIPMAGEGRSERDEKLREKIEQNLHAERQTQATLRRMQKDFLSSIKANAVVLVLLTTVTYAGFLQPPGDLPFGEPMAYMSQRGATQVFIVFNSCAFYFSVSGLLLCVCSSLSPLAGIRGNYKDDAPFTSQAVAGLQTMKTTTKQLSQFVASTLLKLICVNVVFAVALVCCVAAFTAAGFSVTKNLTPHRLSGDRLMVVVTSVVGVLFFGILMLWLFRDIRRFLSKALADQSLSSSLQDRARNLQVQFRYLNADMWPAHS